MRKKSCILILSLAILFSSCGKKGPPSPKSLAPTYAISDLTGEIKDGVLFLSFTVPSQIEGFEVIKKCERFTQSRYIKMDSSGIFTIFKDRIYFMDDELTPENTYTYTVSVYKKGGILYGSSNPFTIKWKDPPGPVEITQTKIDDSVIEISWQKEEGYLYNVYRYEKGSYTIFPLNKKPLDMPYFRDAHPKKEGTYIYEVRKLKKEEGQLWEGFGKPFEVVFKKALILPVPLHVKAEKKGNVIEIRWEIDKKEGIRGFGVYRLAYGKTEKLAEVPPTENIFFDSSFPKTKYVLYFVRSVGHDGKESEDSNIAVVSLMEE